MNRIEEYLNVIDSIKVGVGSSNILDDLENELNVLNKYTSNKLDKEDLLQELSNGCPNTGFEYEELCEDGICDTSACMECWEKALEL